MNVETWTTEWCEKTLNSFNVPNESEWDICDNCRTQTHIHIAKWSILEDKTQLLCKHCQNKIYVVIN